MGSVARVRILGLVAAAILAALVPLACFVPRAPFTGYACDDDHGCVAGQQCVDGVCARPCGADDDCAGDLECRGGQCLPVEVPEGDAGPDGGPRDGGSGDGDGGMGDAGPGDAGSSDGGTVTDAGVLCWGDPPRCFPADDVVTVCPTAPCPPGATEPTLDDALGGAFAVDPVVVFLPPGHYDETVVAYGREVTIIGDEGAVIDGNNSTAVLVAAGGRVVINNVDLDVDDNDPALDLQDTGSSALVERSTIYGSNQQCIVTEAGTHLTLRRSIVTNCRKGAIDLNGGALIEHCIIADSGSIGGGANGSDFGGISVDGPAADVVIRFSTFLDNHANSAPAARCASTAHTLVSVLSWDNAGSSGGEADFPGCSLSYSNVEDVAADAGVLSADPLFVDGGFHLAPGSPCVDQGHPDAGVGVDYDGELRPRGTAPDIGADEAG